MSHLFKALVLSSALIVAAPATAKIATGSNVSDMQVTDSNGTQHNLSDFAGKTVVLEWTNHGCPYVKKHYKTNNMQDLQKEATASDDTVWLSVISSAPGKQGYVSGPKANELTETRGASPTAVVLDETGDLGRTFSARTTPHMYIIDADQTLVYQGAIDDNRSASPASVAGAKNYVRTALAEVKAGTPVSESETAPYGCNVKY
ncbi:MAG: redoxin family protein [Maricaulaceae bacterium]